MKNYIFIFILFSSLVSFAQTKNYLDKPYYSTSATADTLVTPDRIFININISESDTKGKVSVEKLEKKMYSTLRGIGIDTKENLQLNDMASNYKNYLLKRKDILKEKTYTLMVEDAKTLSKVFVALENIGISNTGIQKFEYSEYENMQTLIKLKALKKAKAEANQLTKSIGQSIGKAIYIEDRNFNRGYQSRQKSIMLNEVVAAPEADFEPINIDFQKIKISSNISVIFELN